jgi:hypothetical protein
LIDAAETDLSSLCSSSVSFFHPKVCSSGEWMNFAFSVGGSHLADSCGRLIHRKEHVSEFERRSAIGSTRRSSTSKCRPALIFSAITLGLIGFFSFVLNLLVILLAIVKDDNLL